MEKNDNTLLWLAVIGLAAYVWWTKDRSSVHPGGVNSTQQTAIPGGAAPAAGGTGTNEGAIPVTITQQTMNGVHSVPGRLGNISR